MKNNSINQSFDEGQRVLEKIDFLPGKLLIAKETKYFNSISSTQEELSLYIDTNLISKEGKNKFEKLTVGRNYTHDSSQKLRNINEHKHTKVTKGESLLFLGLKPLKTNIIILNKKTKFTKDLNESFKIFDSKNYSSFYDNSCEWNKSQIIKDIIEQIIDLKFEYKVLQFLYEQKVIWWSIEHLNNEIESLKHLFLFQKSNENKRREK